MIVLKKANYFKKVDSSGDNIKIPDIKFEVYGEEMIEKEVKSNGNNTGRVYLPPNWIGKRVQVIRMD
jgi:putative transposon-encoded protein